MKHIRTYENYQEEHFNYILDKINRNGKDSLKPYELEYLDAYSHGDSDRMDYLEKIEGIKLFTSDDGYFSFQYEETEDYDDEIRYKGILIVPDLEFENGNKIDGSIEGTIISYADGVVSLEFEKDGYDIFEFCNGLEYELDSFVDYVITMIENEKAIK